MAKRQELENQVAQLTAHVNELNMQVETYRRREEAVVYALTEAKGTAAKRIAEAEEMAGKRIAEVEEMAQKRIMETEEQARQILTNAEAKKRDADAHCEAVKQEAAAKAKKIVAEAEREAAATLKQMQEAAKDVEDQLAKLNEALRDTAQRARQQAETFAKSITELRMDSAELSATPSHAYNNPQQTVVRIETAPPPFPVLESEEPEEPLQFQLATGPVGSAAAVEPEAAFPAEAEEPPVATEANTADYEDPQKVIHGIYQLQGRELPREAAETAARSANIGVFSASDDDVAAKQALAETSIEELLGAAPVMEQPMEAFMPEMPPLDDLLTSEPPAPAMPAFDDLLAPTPTPAMPSVDDLLAPAAPAAKPAAQPAADDWLASVSAKGYDAPRSMKSPVEERLWTVDEVMGTAGQDAAPGADGLDNLLDEIMGIGTYREPVQKQQPQQPQQQDSSIDLDSLLDEIIGS